MKTVKRFLILVVVAVGIISCDALEPPPQTPSIKSLSLRIAFDKNMESIVSGITEQFHSSNPTLDDGTRVSIDLIGIDPLRGADDIAAGFTKAQGWIASPSSLIYLANEQTRNLGAEQVDCAPLWASPMVLTGSEAALEKFPSVQSLKQVFRNEQLQRSLSIAHVNVRGNVDGFSAVAQLSYLADELLSRDSKEPGSPDTLVKDLRWIENSVDYYSNDLPLLLQRVAHAPAENPLLALVPEYAVARYNLDHASPSESRLKAIYPEEGSVWNDFNFCESRALWVTPAHEAALKTFKDFLISKPIQYAVARLGYRPSIEDIPDVEPFIGSFGIDKASPEKSLPPLGPDKTKTIIESWGEVRRPSATLFALDTSGSMENSPQYLSQDFVRKALAATSGREDQSALLIFGQETELLQDFSSNPVPAINKLNKVHSRGKSVVFEGLREALHIISKDSLKKFRRTLVVITDGQQNPTPSVKEELIKLAHLARESHVLLIVIGFNHENLDFSTINQIIQEANGIFIETNLEQAPVKLTQALSLLLE